MNWRHLRHVPWLDTRARFVARTPGGGALLDLGSSDGETLRHIAELRPDLRLFAADVAGRPEAYAPGCEFHRGDLEREKLPWPDRSVEAITCMHLVEHLENVTLLMQEAARLLKPGGRFYIETPHPKSLTLPSLRGKADIAFTLNFYDDPTHVKLVSVDVLAQEVQRVGLEVVDTGTSRNWLFAVSHLFYIFLPASRRKFTARVHWLGWSAYLIAQRPS
ncbi:MAG: class I SAM-dependent methyltransferase [Verrucomicrobia bacterium]|nr:class I SAM-dependent methyltransferase [Verrucomicrobiota bacterium]